MTSWPISTLIELGIELDQFDHGDWRYDVNKDIVFVRKESKLYTWIILKKP